jgi:Tfp pilus assembly protein PilO
MLAGSVGVVALLFWLAGYRPQSSKMQNLIFKMAGTQNKLEASQKQAVRLPDVAAKLASLKEQVSDSQQLPTKPELGEFMSQITDLSHKSGLSKIEVHFTGAAQQYEQFGQRPVQLQFDGDFLQVFAFLSRAESMPRLTRISNIAIHSADMKSGIVHVDVTMNVYFAEG